VQRLAAAESLQNVQALFQGLDEEGGFGHKRGSSMRGQGGRCPKRGAMLALRKRHSPFDHYAVAIHDNRNSMNFIDVRSHGIDMGTAAPIRRRSSTRTPQRNDRQRGWRYQAPAHCLVAIGRFVLLVCTVCSEGGRYSGLTVNNNRSVPWFLHNANCAAPPWRQ